MDKMWERCNTICLLCRIMLRVWVSSDQVWQRYIIQKKGSKRSEESNTRSVGSDGSKRSDGSDDSGGVSRGKGWVMGQMIKMEQICWNGQMRQTSQLGQNGQLSQGIVCQTFDLDQSLWDPDIDLEKLPKSWLVDKS